MDNVEQYIEALIFASEQSIRTEEIIYCLQSAFGQDFSEQEIKNHLQNITDKYKADQFAIEVVKISNGYQFLTKKSLPSNYQPVTGTALEKEIKSGCPGDAGYNCLQTTCY